MIRTRFVATVLIAGMASAGTVSAKVSQSKASELGGKLTAVGAIKSGGANGRIPAYNGGLTKPPADFKPGSGHYPDPFADEKPLYTITSQNLNQYKDQLSEGIAAVFKQYPDFKMPVYPTHRTAPYPDWARKNSIKNATTAELAGNPKGLGIKNAYGGVPFPIPQNGYEVLWNAFLSYQGTFTDQRHARAMLVDSNGHLAVQSIVRNRILFTWYNKDQDKLNQPYYYKLWSEILAPPATAGLGIMRYRSINYSKNDQIAYSYSPGQRRVRVAPSFQYDTPVAVEGGALNFDESTMYNGNPKKFDWKLIGRKTILVPYNAYKWSLPSSKASDIFRPKFPNPDYMRWELHRVWVIQGDLKPSARHVFKKRRFYIDEDSWAFLLTEEYDHAGKLARVGINMPRTIYDGHFLYYNTYIFLNLQAGNYVGVNFMGGTPQSRLLHDDKVTAAHRRTLRPDSMARTQY